jgi:hypothetical protein
MVKVKEYYKKYIIVIVLFYISEILKLYILALKCLFYSYFIVGNNLV